MREAVMVTLATQLAAVLATTVLATTALSLRLRLPAGK
jgi:hypothetical protein